jgi:hypothetical protein
MTVRRYFRFVFVVPYRLLLYGNLRELSIDWWLVFGFLLCVYTVPAALVCWVIQKAFFPHSTL